MTAKHPVFLIKPPLRHAGFAACILTVLNYARYCEREGLSPVVHIDGSCETRFLDPEYGDNVWEQYFEPIGEYSSATMTKWLQESGGDRPEVRLTDSTIPPLIKASDDSIFTWTFGRWRENPPDDISAWFAEQRRKGRETVRRYVRVKSSIVEKVEDFRREFLEGKAVLGVHMRGTDLAYAPPVSPAEYFPEIETWLASNSEGHVFLATDQLQYLELMKDRYGPSLVFYDCLRSDNSVAPFNAKTGSPYRKGEDVLIDILLLSQCDYLIRGASNIPEMALFFNDELESTDLSLNKRFAFGQDYLSRWSSLATRPAWDLIQKTDLEQVSATASSQNGIQRFVYELRRVCASITQRRRMLRRRIKAFLSD